MNHQKTTPAASSTPTPPDDADVAGLALWREKAKRLSGDAIWGLIGRTAWPDDRDRDSMDPGLFLRNKAMADLLQDVGARFRDSTLDNFVAADPKQKKALSLVRGYLERLDDHVREGNSLIFYGPCGTGKDHLAIGAGRIAVGMGYTVCWTTAQTIFADFRDSFNANNESEADLMRKLLQPDVLIVSDPAPSRGGLSDFQGNVLCRLVDARYIERKPTWTTLNVTGMDDARHRVGVATIDRLVHGATTVFCSWPSYRKPLQ
jgi:DNA replication protein DnaC